jgi:Arm DNA-binding domain/N-terminal domain of M60-like peptidases
LKAIKTKYEIIFNRKKKLNSEGLALIQIRMYLNGFNKYYSTGIYIAPGEWNETAPQHALQTMSMLEIKEFKSVSKITITLNTHTIISTSRLGFF